MYKTYGPVNKEVGQRYRRGLAGATAMARKPGDDELSSRMPGCRCPARVRCQNVTS
jgi:hypothetical protein